MSTKIKWTIEIEISFFDNTIKSKTQLTSFISMFDSMNFIIGQCAQYFDENVFISSDSSHRIMQFLDIKVNNWCQ